MSGRLRTVQHHRGGAGSSFNRLATIIIFRES